MHDNLIAAATKLMQSHNKRSLATLARSLGWRGDDARTPILTLALAVAQRQQAGHKPEQPPASRQDSHSSSAQPGAQPQQGGGDGDSQQQDSDSSDGDGAQQDGAQPPQQQDSQQQDGDGAQQDSDSQPQQDSDSSKQPPQSQQDGASSDGDQQQDGDSQPQQDGAQPPQQRHKDSQTIPAGAAPQPAPTEKQRPKNTQPAPSNAQWKAMLQKAGIDTPHYMLRKVYALAVCARLNVWLTGPAGCGKSMLAEQLAMLHFGTKKKFGFTSCTSGLSESDLLGKAMPTGDNMKFNYVPVPFVTMYETGGVFLADELDRSDANTIIVLNAALANGHIALPSRWDNPIAEKHAESFLLGAANTTGGGADELYVAANQQDGSFMDRWYCITVDYDRAYEASLYGLPAPQPAPAIWRPAAAPSVETLALCAATIDAMRAACDALPVKRIVGTRMHQKAVAALFVGISLSDALRDLTGGWSADEIRRVDAHIKQSGVNYAKFN